MKQRFGVGRGAGKTMHDAGRNIFLVSREERSDDRQKIRIRLAAMNDDGASDLARGVKSVFKGPLLLVRRNRTLGVIQSDFSHGDKAFIVAKVF